MALDLPLEPPPAPDLAAEERIAALLLSRRLQIQDLGGLLACFCEAANEAGVPLDRASLHILQLHPQLRARQFVWARGKGEPEEMGREHGIENTRSYHQSPMKPIFEEGASIRRRLLDPRTPLDFSILPDLIDDGFTDYAARPLRFITGQTNAVTFATRRDSGFAEADLALLDSLLPVLAAVLEGRHVMRTARELMDLYVGPNTGRQILSGAIRRGHGSRIRAALWFCDLRCFTEISELQPLEETIPLLNAYFDCMAQPVEARGGEILKFIGDALLAIFPCEADSGSQRAAADAALTAAEEAAASLAALELRVGPMGEPLRCGIALHIGEIMYGNIGGGRRQDFTAIGPAVNLVTRLEGLCGRLGIPIVASESLAQASSRRFEALESFPLKGIAAPQKAFRPLA